MVYCVAYNCNSRSGHGLGMYTFPKDEHRRKIWVQKVKRHNFVPSEHSRLCSRHFDFDQFVIEPRIASSVKFTPKQRRLKHDAIPMIFDYRKPNEKKSPMKSPGKRKKRTSRAVEKRQRLEVLSLFPIETNNTVKQEQDIIEETLDETIADMADPAEEIVLSEPSQMDTSVSLAVMTDRTEVFHVDTQTESKLLWNRSNVSVQTEKRGIDCSTQTDNAAIRAHIESCDNSCDEYNESDCSDSEWYPTDDETDSVKENIHINNEAKERKFIVFESELDTLFFHCDKCTTTIKPSNIEKKVIGTMVQVTTNCECGDIRVWRSQPMSYTMPLGNLILAGAILFSGSNPCKVVNLMRHAGVQFFSIRTFNYMQTAYVVPVINSVWEVKQLDLLRSIREAGQDLILGGDARCCSPGHTAKYGSCSVMNLSTSKIVDIQLVQSNEVNNSYAMELEGLTRCFEFLSNEDVKINTLITDRHSQVKKYMREKKPEIKHMFDVWHIAKGSAAHLEMEKVIAGKLLLKDITKLSPAEQTSGLESFHNVVCYFAPKSTHFFYWQMRARLYLSALHFNENSCRSQAVTSDGKPQFSISYPKGRKGDAIAKEVKVNQTFGYIDELTEELIYREANPSYKRALQIASVDKRAVVSPPVAGGANRKDKDDVVAAHVNRFN